jgi:hypothetical protein
MTKKTKAASSDVLEELHAALAKALKDRIESGEATAADLSVVRQFLRDNNIDAIPNEGSPLDDLRNALPFPTPEGVRDEEDNSSLH